MVVITVVNGGDPITIRTAGSRRLNPLVDADVDFQRFRAINARIKGASEEYLALGDVADSVELDLSVASVFSATLTAAVVVSFAGVPPTGQAASVALQVVNPAAFAVTWPAEVDWGDDDPTDVPATGLAMFAFITTNGGTSWLGVVSFTRDDS